MARIDDFKQARDLARKQLAAIPLDRILERSGFKSVPGKGIGIPFLNRNYHLTYPELSFVDASEPDQEIPLQEQVLILHYLKSEDRSNLSGEWIPYREIPGAAFYYGAFVKRAADPLKKVFGHQPELLKTTALKLEGIPVDMGDIGFEFKIFPLAPVRLILWEGDDEFPPEATILFDRSIGEIFSPEDAAWLGSLLVYRLMALSRPLSKSN